MSTSATTLLNKSKAKSLEGVYIFDEREMKNFMRALIRESVDLTYDMAHDSYRQPEILKCVKEEFSL